MQKQSIEEIYEEIITSPNIPFEPNKYIWVHSPEPRYYFLHYHNVIEIGLCIKGSGFFYVNGEKIPFKAPCASIINPNDFHSAESNKNDLSEWYFMYISLEDLFIGRSSNMTIKTLLNSYQTHESPIIFNKKQHKDIYNLIKLVIKEMQNGKENYILNISNLMQSVLIMLTRNKKKEIKKNQKNNLEKILSCINYINEKYAENITIHDLCKISCLSESTLNRYFLSTLSITPYQYIESVRLDSVTYQLNKNRSITEIAIESGFNSISTFNRAFQKKYHMSPREYKKLNQQ